MSIKYQGSNLKYADTVSDKHYMVIYTVTFVDWNGTTLKTEIVDSGGNATPPANPTRTNYTFTVWSGTYTNVTSNRTITATYTIYPLVTFVDWDASVLKTEYVAPGGNATPPADPTRSGWGFTGWSGTYANVTANVTITATYVEGGQTEYVIPGLYSWVCPAGVTSVCVVAIGGGGGGVDYPSGTHAMNGGAGGGLGWKNNIPVIPGNSYTVFVGAGGSHNTYGTSGGSGMASYFIDGTTVAGHGGAGGTYPSTLTTGGSFVGDGGGAGGGNYNPSSSGYGPSGGGGAGGYNGSGGRGSVLSADISYRTPSGGGGWGGNNNGSNAGFGGGGTSVYGADTSDTQSDTLTGKTYGGGGGGSTINGTTPAGDGAGGAVRIIWGAGRSFPITNTQDY